MAYWKPAISVATLVKYCHQCCCLSSYTYPLTRCLYRLCCIHSFFGPRSIDGRACPCAERVCSTLVEGIQILTTIFGAYRYVNAKCVLSSLVPTAMCHHMLLRQFTVTLLTALPANALSRQYISVELGKLCETAERTSIVNGVHTAVYKVVEFEGVRLIWLEALQVNWVVLHLV